MMDTRQMLAEDHLDLPGEVVGQFLAKRGSARRFEDDLHGAANLALLEAAKAWPRGTENFRGWARNRIWWALQDELDTLQATIRPREEKRQAVPMTPLDDTSDGDRPLSEVLPSGEYTEEEVLVRIQSAELRSTLRSNLTATQYRIISRVYGLDDEGPMTLTAAADLEGVSRPTLTAWIHQAFAELRETVPNLRALLE